MGEQHFWDVGRTKNPEPQILFADLFEPAKPCVLPDNKNAKEFLESCQVSFFMVPPESTEDKTNKESSKEFPLKDETAKPETPNKQPEDFPAQARKELREESNWLKFQNALSNEIKLFDLKLNGIADKSPLEVALFAKELDQLFEDLSKRKEKDKSVVSDKLKNEVNELTRLKQSEQALQLSRALILISTGVDENIKQGEECLKTVVMQNPALQRDEKFHELILSKYCTMAEVRKSRGLAPWAPKVDVGSDAAKTESNQPSALELFNAANKRLPEQGLKACIEDHNKAKAAAESETKQSDKMRKSAFERGLAKNAEIANAQAQNKSVDQLLDQRLIQIKEEQELAKAAQVKSLLLRDIQANTSLTKIAFGDDSGLKELKSQMIFYPELALDKVFQSYLGNAFYSYNKKAEGDDKPIGETYCDPKSFANSQQKNDETVEVFAAEEMTAVAVLGVTIGLLVGSSMVLRLRDRRALLQENGVKPLKDPPPVESLRPGETGMKVTGATSDGQKLVLQDSRSKDDWRKNNDPGKPVGQDFDLKKQKYDGHRRIIVEGKDFFVSTDNKVYAHRNGRLFETKEFQIVDNPQKRPGDAVPSDKVPTADAKQPRDTTAAAEVKPKPAEPKLPEAPAASKGSDKGPAAESARSSTPTDTTKDKGVQDLKSAELPSTSEELFALATKADNNDLAINCVKRLADLKPDGYADTIRKLAKGDSRAAASALMHLQAIEFDEAWDLMADRWKNGEMQKLFKEGKVRNHEMLFLYGDKAEELWKDLENNPTAKGKFANTALRVQKIPGAPPRFFYDDIPKETKAKLFEYLVENKPNGWEAVISGLTTLDEKQPLAEKAREIASTLWVSQEQTPGKKAVHPFFLKEKIRDFCKAAANADQLPRMSTKLKQLRVETEAQKMDDQAVLAKKLPEHLAEQVEIAWDKPEKVRELLKDHPQALKEYEGFVKNIELAKRIDQVEIDVEIARMEFFETQLNQFCRENGLPKITITFQDGADAGGSYRPGSNIYRLQRFLFEPGNRARMVGTGLHELGHHEQSTTVLRDLMDELKIGKAITDTEKAQLQKLHLERTGYNLTESFLNAVLVIRNGERLNQGDHDRAIELAKAFKSLQESSETSAKNKERAEKITEALKTLKAGGSPSDLFKGGSHQELLDLLGTKSLPDSVKKELADMTRYMQDGDFANAKAARERLRIELVTELTDAGLSIALESFGSYRARFHEQETHAINDRCDFFNGEQVERKQRKTMTPEEELVMLEKQLKDLEQAAKEQRAAERKSNPSEEQPQEAADRVARRLRLPGSGRNAIDYSKDNQSTVMDKSFELCARYRQLAEASKGTSSSTNFLARFESNAQSIFLSKVGDTDTDKVGQLDKVVREFSSQVESLKNSELIRNATIVSSDSLGGGAGRVVFKQGGKVVEPLYCDAKNAYLVSEMGEVTAVPLADMKVEFHLPEEAIKTAGDGTTEGSAKARELVATLYHQVSQVEQLRSRAQRAKAAGVNLERTNLNRQDVEVFLQQEKANVDLSSEFLQFKLNGNSLNNKDRFNPTPEPFDAKKSADAACERVMIVNENGHVKIIIGTDRRMTEMDLGRSRRSVEQGFDKVAGEYERKMETARKSGDEKEFERLKLERDQIVQAKEKYQTDPEYRSRFNGRMAGAGGRFVAGAGIATTALFVITFVVDKALKEERAEKPNLNVPVKAK